MKIYPTNNSISYKILKSINNKIFGCGVPNNICGYFWLSIFYGVFSTFLLYTTFVTILTLTQLFFNTDPSLINNLPFGLSLVGILLGCFIAVLLWVMFWLILCIVLPITFFLVIVLLIAHLLFKDRLVYKEPSQYALELLMELSISIENSTLVKIIEKTLKYLWSLKRFIKCKKLDFDE